MSEALLSLSEALSSGRLREFISHSPVRPRSAHGSGRAGGANLSKLSIVACCHHTAIRAAGAQSFRQIRSTLTALVLPDLGSVPTSKVTALSFVISSPSRRAVTWKNTSAPPSNAC
jgi:hypothetical protein